LHGQFVTSGSLANDAITDYGFAYGTSSSITSMTKKSVGTSIIDGTKFRAAITGLDSGRHYYFMAYVKFGSTYYYGSELSFTTTTSGEVTVTTKPATLIGTDYATVNGKIVVTNDETIDEYGFYYGTSSNKEEMYRYEAGSTINADTYLVCITGLAKNKTYYFIAYGTTDIATYYGSTLQFTTGVASSGGSAVTTREATPVGDTYATLNAFVDSNGGDEISEYGFYFGPDAATSFKKKGGTSIETGSYFKHKLSGLTPGTDYYFKAYTTNAAGTTYGKVKSFTTEAYRDKPTVVTEAPAIDGANVTLNGSITSKGDTDVKSYGFYYGTSISPTIPVVVGYGSLTAGEVFSYKLTGLSSGTTYYVKAYATNSAGTAYGDVLSFAVSGVSFYPSIFTLGSNTYNIRGSYQAGEAAPYVKNNRTFIPLRYAVYAMGLTDSDITWDEAAQTVTLKKDATVVRLTVNSPVIYVNGDPILMDTAPELTANRTCLPIAFVARAFGYSAIWDGALQTVTIR